MPPLSSACYLLALVCALLLSSEAMAQTTYTWDGGAIGPTTDPTSWDITNANWTGSLWVNDPVNSTASFTGASPLSITLNSAIQAAGIQFSGTGGYTLTGSGLNTLTIGVGGIINGSSALQTINASVILNSAQQWSDSGFGVTVGGAISGAANATLTWAGTGALSLTGANTSFLGGVTVTNGLLNIGNVSALGTGTLTMQGGSFDNTTNGLITLANAQTWNGNFTFVGSSSITVSSSVTVALSGNSVLTLNGTTATAAGINPLGTLVLGTGATSATVLISDSSAGKSLTVAGTGTLNLLFGTSSFSGGLTIGGGTAIGPATVVLGNSSTVGAENPASLGTGTVTLNTGGKLWAQPGSTTNIYAFANNFVFNGGTFVGQDGVQHLATGVGATINIQTGGGTIDATWNGKDVYVDGILTGSGPLTLAHGPTGGSNPLIHFTNGANTYSGIVSLSGATSTSVLVSLSLDAATAIQYATVNTLTGTAPGLLLVNVSGGATVGALTGTAGTIEPATTAGTYTLTLAGSALNATNTFGGVLANNTGILALSMTNANNASAVQILSGNNTFTGAVAVNSGTLTLSGSNVYTGATTVSGTLNISGSVTASPSLTVNSGGTLNLSGSYTTAAGTTSISGLMLVTGTSTSTGATTINPGGTLQIGNGGATGSIAAGRLSPLQRAPRRKVWRLISSAARPQAYSRTPSQLPGPMRISLPLAARSRPCPAPSAAQET